MTLPLHSSWHHHPDMLWKKAANILWNCIFLSRISSHSYKLSVWIWSLDSRPGFSTTKIFGFWRRRKKRRRFLWKCQKIMFDPFAVRSFVLILSGINVANTQEYNFKFPDVKQQLLCWFISERDKNRQLLPWQKWISVKFEFKHDSNLKLSNAQLLPTYDRFSRSIVKMFYSKTPLVHIFDWLLR